MPKKEKKSPGRLKLFPEVGVASRKATQKVKKYETMEDIPKWLYPFFPLLVIIEFASMTFSQFLLPLEPIQIMFFKPFVKNIHNIKLSIKLDKKVKDTEKIMESLEKFNLYKMFKDSIPEKYLRVYLEDDEKTISMYIIIPQKILREKIKSDSLSPLLSKFKQRNEIPAHHGMRSHRVANVAGQLRKKEIMDEIITFFKKFKTINIGREKYKIMEISYGAKKVREGTDVSKLADKFSIISNMDRTNYRSVMVVKPHEKKLPEFSPSYSYRRRRTLRSPLMAKKRN